MGYAIRAAWLLALIVPLVLAWRVLFSSPDMYEYLVNREQFYLVAAWCTGIYFLFAYGELQRNKILAKRAARDAAGPPTDRRQQTYG